MAMNVQATALHPFVPSGPDFEMALAFFSELGFEKQWQKGDCAGLRFGGASFVLQHITIPVWQENQMITYEVDDLDAYWAALEARDLPAKYDGVKLKEPTDYDWGREIHIIDPAGVCWHVRTTGT